MLVVKALSRLVDNKSLKIDLGEHETILCNLVPKKVNVFVWRAMKRRLLVRVELDRRGIDLHSILCPCCDVETESVEHCLVLCKVARSVWEEIFKWWKIDRVNVLSTNEILRCEDGVSSRIGKNDLWQIVTWTTCYFIRKHRNERVLRRSKKGSMYMYLDNWLSDPRSYILKMGVLEN